MDFHVVCDPCHDCKYTDCVVVCPVDCFYEDDKQLYIDPDTCIDCEACVGECPVEAIYQARSVPTQWQAAIQLNADKSAALKTIGGANITDKKDALEGPDCKKK